jgi:hypothetical protein
MSTRATYQFISEWSGTHTAYIHHDGYPEGAANYLSNGEKPITSIDSFIRANDKAEMTSSHEAHGDTEYRYTVMAHVLTAEKRVNFTDTFVTFWQGNVADFIMEADEWVRAPQGL